VLVVGIAGEAIGTRSLAGAVALVPVGSNGLDVTRSFGWTQASFGGRVEAGDVFGASLG
jgi:hypothetical protein